MHTALTLGQLPFSANRQLPLWTTFQKFNRILDHDLDNLMEQQLQFMLITNVPIKF